MYNQRDFMRLTLTHFECFIQVAEAGTTLKAAEALNLSQPVVSQKIAQLERAVQLELFDRSKHRLILTEAGCEFLEKSKSMFREWDTFLQNMTALCPEKNAPLRLGFSEGQESSAIHAIVGELTQRMPEAKIELTIGNRSLIAEKLLSGELDVLFIVDTENLSANKKIRYRKIASLPLNCLFHRTSKFAQKQNLTCYDFAHSTCYWPESLKNTRNQREQKRYFSERGIDIEWKYQDVDSCTIRRYLSSGDCFTLTWNRTLDDPGLKLYPLRDITCPVILAWKREDSARLKEYLDKLLAVLQKLCETD